MGECAGECYLKTYKKIKMGLLLKQDPRFVKRKMNEKKNLIIEIESFSYKLPSVLSIHRYVIKYFPEPAFNCIIVLGF